MCAISNLHAREHTMEQRPAYMLRYPEQVCHFAFICIQWRLAYMLRYPEHVCHFAFIHVQWPVILQRNVWNTCSVTQHMCAIFLSISCTIMNNDHIKQRLAYMRCVMEHVCHFARAPFTHFCYPICYRLVTHFRAAGSVKVSAFIGRRYNE